MQDLSNDKPFGCAHDISTHESVKSSLSDLETRNLLIYQSSKWPLHSALKVYFIDKNSQKRNDLVMMIANEWSQFVNLRFEETDNKDQNDIRITYESTLGSWSYVGIECKKIPIG